MQDIEDDFLSEQDKEKLRNYRSELLAKQSRRTKKVGCEHEQPTVSQETVAKHSSLSKELLPETKKRKRKRSSRNRKSKARRGLLSGPQDDQSSQLGELDRCLDAAGGETGDQPRQEGFSSQARELGSGVYSQEDLGLQWLSWQQAQLVTCRTAYFQVRFSPPYPHSSPPFLARQFHPWPSTSQPPCHWPHPLFFCRPPRGYPFYV